MIPASTRRVPHRRRAVAIAATALLAAAMALPLTATAAAADDATGLAGSDLYVNPWSTTLEAAQSLSGQARDDAQLLGSIPSAEWLTSGTPAEAEAAADAIVTAAAAQGRMPVLVAYNLPFRDCAQYSAGGATSTAEYEAWIDAVAAGIGDRPASVILEPDGLGIIPWYTTINGDSEWCKPAEADPATAASERFVQLNHAVQALKSGAATSVYLDGTHSGWLGVGDITDRLMKAGVADADGFFLNASNYVPTERLQKYGSWISQCLDLSQHTWWQPQWCASQYYPASPSDFSTWGLSDAAFAQAYADTGRTMDPAAMAHFVIDTSRNGQGTWTPPAGVYSDPEDWCNPPGRGLGERPSTDTGDPLIDAYLWIKVPGESDGKCYRGTAGPIDPERGYEDPAACQWFVQQARELIALADPAIAPLDCHVEWTPSADGTSAAVRLSGEVGDGFSLSFAVPDGQHIARATRAAVAQSADVVTVTGATKRTGNAPDTVVHAKGVLTTPWQFLLDGRACTS
ncbi:glycoside hydrolase family 6 protein [Microbacterium kyungheense]|uniref:Glucanase n=1 Tax=Microbacterium kyungheense TaxID=1263636 RepID=A0A543EUN4_9MICO|nr:glycoside hydrolase family 6 protein [Microbacterium kyungheense]TQM25282.1 endoglucanase [Microbacterium kyungheense]